MYYTFLLVISLAHMERIGGELANSESNKESPHLQNGYSLNSLQQSFDPLPESVFHPLQQLLMVLSNIGYCKDELSHELYNRYKHIWLHSRLVQLHIFATS